MPHDFGSSLRDRLIRNRGVSDSAADERGELKPGERRDIAVLFLDLEGFTSLSEKLDHEAVHDIASGIMDALVDVTQRFAGYVDKIEGDRIMVLFGARQAGENDSTRAVSSGFMMLDTILAANDILSDTGIPITARIGINSGPVTVAPDAIGHLTAMGKTVNLASRMEEAAQANTILVPDTFHQKCSDQFTWEDIGIIKLKGISNPVHAWRPTGSISASRPRWERVSTVCRSGFVGRAAELFRLRKKLQNRTFLFENPDSGIQVLVKESGMLKGTDFIEVKRSRMSGDKSRDIRSENCDLFYRAIYDEETGDWSVFLKPGGPNGGILVSDQMLYVAPEDEYQPELSFVPDDGVMPDARYIYLKTRSPPIFSRIEITHVIAFENFFRMNAKVATNPYGDRVLDSVDMESLSSKQRLKLKTRLKSEAQAALREGRLPERPKIMALIEAAKRGEE